MTKLHTQNKQYGAALIVVLILLIIASSVAVTMASRSGVDVRIAQNDTKSKQALFVANAGYAITMQYLENEFIADGGNIPVNVNKILAGATGNLFEGISGVTETIDGKVYRKISTSGGDAFVRVEDNNDDTTQTTDADGLIWIVSIGRVGTSEREVRALILSGFSVPGMFGKELLELTGSSNIDAYPGGPFLTANIVSGAAGIGSNEHVEISGGGSSMSGDAFIGTGGIYSGNPSRVSGSIYYNQPIVNFPEIDPCGNQFSSIPSGIMASYDTSVGDLDLGGGDTFLLTETNYCFNNISMNSSAKLLIPIGNQVTLFVDGLFEMTGGEIKNLNEDATFFRIRSSYSGSDISKLRGGGTTYLTLYAPESNYVLTGNSAIHGIFVANTLRMTGSGDVHLDLAARNFYDFVLQEWVEVRRQ